MYIRPRTTEYSPYDECIFARGRIFAQTDNLRLIAYKKSMPTVKKPLACSLFMSFWTIFFAGARPALVDTARPALVDTACPALIQVACLK